MSGNEKKNKFQRNKSRDFIEKNNSIICINCVNEVLNAEIKKEFEEDYFFILDRAFMDLEDIGRVVKDNFDKNKSKDYDSEEDYSIYRNN